MLLNPDRVTMNYTMADVVRPDAHLPWLGNPAVHVLSCDERYEN